MAKTRKHLGEILYKAGVVEKQALINAIRTSRTNNKRLGQVLLELGLIDEETLTKAIAKQFGLQYVDLDKTPIPSDAGKIIPTELIKRTQRPASRHEQRQAEGDNRRSDGF